jgi:hypothetical protein
MKFFRYMLGSVKQMCDIVYQGAKAVFIADTSLNTYDFACMMKNYLYDHWFSETSSAIYIKELKGSLAVTSSTFSYIAGRSGSVFAINGYTTDSSIAFTSNTFSNNFAYKGYPSIRVTAFTTTYYNSYSECTSENLLTVLV